MSDDYGYHEAENVYDPSDLGRAARRLKQHEKAALKKAPAVKMVMPSWHAFVAAAQRPPAPGIQQFSREEGAHALLFRGTEQFDEAIDLAINGWQSGSDRAIEQAEDLATKIKRYIVKSEPMYRTEGSAIDIDRFLGGDPLCWQDWAQGGHLARNVDPYADVMRQRLVKLVVNVSPGAEVTAEAIDTRGAATLALVRIMEFAGHRVEVNVVLASQAKGGRVEVWVPVKRLTEPMNCPRIAFALSHRAMVRRLMFAVMEAQVMPDDRCNSGYGRAVDVAEVNQGDIYLGCLKGNTLSQVEASQGWLLVQLKEQGIAVTEDAATVGA